MFLDTLGLLCFHHKGEPQHADAVHFFEAASLRLTHGYDFAEFVAVPQHDCPAVKVVVASPCPSVVPLVGDIEPQEATANCAATPVSRRSTIARRVAWTRARSVA